MRVLAEPGFDAGPVIEYALEPVVNAATEELTGVSRAGSGDEEEAQVRAITGHPPVARAAGFCRRAADFLGERPSPGADDLCLLGQNAAALTP